MIENRAPFSRGTFPSLFARLKKRYPKNGQMSRCPLIQNVITKYSTRRYSSNEESYRIAIISEVREVPQPMSIGTPNPNQ